MFKSELNYLLGRY